MRDFGSLILGKYCTFVCGTLFGRIKLIVHGGSWRVLVTRKSLTRGHVAFDTSSFFRKIAVCLDSPHLQQIAFKRKMPKNAIACRTSIRRFK